MRARAWIRMGVVAASAALGQIGCAEILGLLDRPIDDDTSGTGAGTTTTTTDVGGAGGTGGTGSTVGTFCQPGAELACAYSGPPSTEGVGTCTAATRICNEAGTAFGPCEGEVLPAEEDASKIGDEGCDGYLPGEAIWSQRFGGTGNQQAVALAVDAAGNIYLAGSFAEKVNLGGQDLTSAGSSDIFLAKLDPLGKHVWSKRLGDGEAQEVGDLAVDQAGYLLLTGGFYGTIDFGSEEITSAGGRDIFLAKFEPSGAYLTSRHYGGSGDESSSSIAVTQTNDIYMTGLFTGSIDFGSSPLTSQGSTDIFLAKLDSSLGLLWSYPFGDSASQAGQGVAADASSGVWMTGNFRGEVDFGEGPVTTTGGQDVFVTHIDAGSGYVSASFFGDMLDFQTGTAIGVDSTGSAVITGSFFGTLPMDGETLTSTGGQDVFLVKLGEDGAYVWGQSYGDANTQQPKALALDAQDNILLAGYFNGAIDFGDGGSHTSGGAQDAFLAKLDTAGKHLWSKRFGDQSDNQVATDVLADPDGNVIVCGYFAGTADFGNGVLGSAGGWDLFVAKFAK